jgi:hypothetical protein
MTRYFKATDGQVTVFRQSRHDVFRSADFRSELMTRGWSLVGSISFVVTLPWHPDSFATKEISAAEYNTLAVLKERRLLADYCAQAALAASRSPQNSWVRNADLERMP